MLRSCVGHKADTGTAWSPPCARNWGALAGKATVTRTTLTVSQNVIIAAHDTAGDESFRRLSVIGPLEQKANCRFRTLVEILDGL
jgi:hypothetical protein